MLNIVITIISSGLFASLVILILQNRYYRNEEKRKQKFEIFKQLMGHRNALANNFTEENKVKFFEALNTAFVVFYQNQEVLNALNNFHLLPGRNIDTLTELFKAICDDLKIETDFLGDEFFQKPFTRK